MRDRSAGRQPRSLIGSSRSATCLANRLATSRLLAPGSGSARRGRSTRRRAVSGIIRPMSNEPGHVWVDGRILLAAGPHLSAFDRGFQLGDGVFETLRARAGQPAELDEHLLRLRRSADGLAIELPADLDERLAAAIADLLAAERLAGPDGDAS